MEVYIDNKITGDHLSDLAEVFGILSQKLRLNVSKCVFGVSLGKFLRYLITCRGIEVNIDQISAIQRLNPQKNPKEVQKLMGMIVALNRFVSKSANECHPFFQLLRKWKNFRWMEECDNAFQILKLYLEQQS